MRAAAHQVEWLAALWDLLPEGVEAELVVKPEPVLVVGRCSAAVGDYGYLIRDGEDVVAADLDAKAACEQLLERSTAA